MWADSETGPSVLVLDAAERQTSDYYALEGLVARMGGVQFRNDPAFANALLDAARELVDRMQGRVAYLRPERPAPQASPGFYSEVSR